eukprot:gene17535-19285_t
MDGKSMDEMIREAQQQVQDLLWIKVVGLGNSGVGKTCLVKTFCESKFSKNYSETIGVDYARVTFWDFGGSETYIHVRKELYHQTKVCLLVYDVTNTQSFYALDDWIKEFETFGGKGSTMFAIGNKIDLKPKKVNLNIVQEWAQRRKIQHYYASAATGDGVSNLFNDILSQIPNMHTSVVIACALIVSCFGVAISINKIDDAASHCKTMPFNYTIAIDGCYPMVIANNFCYGQCKSHFLPQVKDLGIPTFSCSACYPVVKRIKKFYLKCPSADGFKFKPVRVMMVVNCECKISRCHSLYYWKPRTTSAGK